MFTDEGFAGESVPDPSHLSSDGEPPLEDPASSDAVSSHLFDVEGAPDEGPAAADAESGAGEPAFGGVPSNDLAGTSSHHAPDIVYTSADGTEIPLGAPDQDLDGDGVAESVAVRTGSGEILMLSDTDGDGHPDQLIQVDPNTGAAAWAVPDHLGGWEIVQTGHMAADGSLVVDPGEHGNQHTVEVAVPGNSFDAGPATIDTDGDGVPDTVSVVGPSGSTLFYQDSNGDGTADRAWSTDSSGKITANYTIGAGGNWVSTSVAGGG